MYKEEIKKAEALLIKIRKTAAEHGLTPEEENALKFAATRLNEMAAGRHFIEEYAGIDIYYDINENYYAFLLDGIDRAADSVTEAETTIEEYKETEHGRA